MAFEFKLPDIGEGVSEGEIVQWLVAPGEKVEEDQAIVELMTDKATVEIASPKQGTIEKLFGDAGQSIAVGSPLASIAVSQESSSDQAHEKNEETFTKKEAKQDQKEASQTQDTSSSLNGTGDPSLVLASPATRKLAREKGIDLYEVKGTGDHGRVTLEDVKSFTGTSPSAKPALTKTSIPSGEKETRIPLKGIRKVIAQNMRKSVDHAAHFSHMDEVDAQNLVAARSKLKDIAKEKGIQLSYLPFLVKALCCALKDYPMLNASLDEEAQEIVVKNYYNIGIAVATKDEDLVVPVIANADQKGLLEIAQEIRELADKAQSNKLTPQDLSGGTFTITSLGVLAGTYATPIINYPQVGILGFYAIQDRPVVRNSQVVIRKMANLSVSIDHRVVDGALAAKFTKALIQYLETPESMLL